MQPKQKVNQAAELENKLKLESFGWQAESSTIGIPKHGFAARSAKWLSVARSPFIVLALYGIDKSCLKNSGISKKSC